MKQPNQHFIDKHTSIDDLLATLIEQNALLLDAIDVDIDDEVHFFTYPKNGTRAALAAGTTELDYEQGTVIDVDGGTSDMNSSLRRIHKPACRSIALNADQDLIIQINNKDRIPVTAGTWFKATYLRFQRVKIITTATTTNTFILACTHPNAIDISGEVLIKDTTDVWGNSVPMGLGELAVRTHAPPIVFDRRGDVLRWVDFESATQKFIASTLGGTPTYNRSNTTATNGSFSYLISGAAAADSAQVAMQTNDFHVGNIGYSVSLASDDIKYSHRCNIYYYTGSDFYRATLKYDKNTEKLYYLNSSSSYVEIADIPYSANKYNFSTFKVVVDLTNMKYLRAICFGNEYDLSEHTLYSTNSAVTRHIKGSSIITGIDATAFSVYIDNMILTENEPA